MRPLNLGMPFTPADMDEWLDSPPPEAAVKRHRRTPENRMQAMRDRRATALRQLMLERHGNVLDWCGETATGVADSASDIARQAQELLKAMKAGAVSPEEVMKAITRNSSWRRGCDRRRPQGFRCATLTSRTASCASAASTSSRHRRTSCLLY